MRFTCIAHIYAVEGVAQKISGRKQLRGLEDEKIVTGRWWLERSTP